MPEIIEERGNVNRAQTRLVSEQKAMDEILDFTQLLTSAAMHADIIKASNATQRLAIALSKDWVISAYENITLKVRQQFPQDFQIDIEGWKGITSDGSEENTLMSSAESHFTKIRDEQIAATKQSCFDIVLPIIFAVLSIFGFASEMMWGLLLLVGAAGFALRWYLKKKKIEQRKQEIRDRFDGIIADVKNTIKAICAERVDYIRHLKEQDDVSDETLEYIKEINPVQYVAHAEGRSVR